MDNAPELELFFSDFFKVDSTLLEEYGAFNISLAADLPLFIDPFLLFNSEKQEYQELHDRMIEYLLFFRDNAAAGPISTGLLRAWFTFSEVKQHGSATLQRETPGACSVLGSPGP